MGGGPASADVVRSSCFVTFPEQAHADPVPVDAWYLFAAGLTFLRRLSRDRVGNKMPIALLLQVPLNNDDNERRYVSVNSNTVLQRALQETFECPEKAVVLHVINVGKVRGQKRIYVRPEVNPNVSPEPVEPLAMVFPRLSVDEVVVPSAVKVPTVQVTSKSLDDEMSQSMVKDQKNDNGQGNGTRFKKIQQLDKSLSQSAFFVEERDYTKRDTRQEQHEKRRQKAGVPVAVEAVGELLPRAKQATVESNCVEQETESDIPVATVVEADAAHIPSDYVMLELQTGAGLPEAPANTSSTYFISSRWAEQADEMSASMRLERLPTSRATRVRAAASANVQTQVNLEDSFVILDRQEL